MRIDTESFETELTAYVEHLNNLLQENEKVQSYLPLEPSELISLLSDGIVLNHSVHEINQSAISVSKLNYGIDMQEIQQKIPGSKSVFQVTENLNNFINGVKNLGVKVVNIGAEDILEGNQDLIMGLLWQLIRAHLLQEVNVVAHPELIRLMQKGETIQTLIEMPSEQILLRWINYHLNRSDLLSHNNPEEENTENNNKVHVQSFSDEMIKNGHAYLILMREVAPNLCDEDYIKTSLENDNSELRAFSVLETASKLGCRKYVTAADIISGNTRLNLGFVANLFNHHIGIHLPSEDEIRALYRTIDELKEKVNNLESTLTTEVENHKQDNEKNHQQIQKLESKVEEQSTELAELNEKIHQLETDLQVAQENILRRRKSFDALSQNQQSVNGALQEELEVFEKKYSEEKKLRIKLSKELNDQLENQSQSSKQQIEKMKMVTRNQYGEMMTVLKNHFLKSEMHPDLPDSIKKILETNFDDEETEEIYSAVNELIFEAINQNRKHFEENLKLKEQIARMKKYDSVLLDKITQIGEELNKKTKEPVCGKCSKACPKCSKKSVKEK